MNNEQLVLSLIRPTLGYKDIQLHGIVNKAREITREEFIESIKNLQKARLVERKHGDLFKIIR